MITVVAVSGYASISRDLSFGGLRLGAVNAEGLVNGEGGQVGNVTLGRMSTIVKPLAVPTTAPTPHVAIFYLVSGTETVASIATRFGVSTDDIYWSNPWLKSDHATNGQKLAVPPLDGVVVTVQKGQSISDLAQSYHVDVATIRDFNYLRSDALSAGQQLILPGGRGPQVVLPTPTPSATPTPDQAAASTNATDATSARSAAISAPAPPVGGSGGSVSSGGAAPGGYSANRFAFGYCTWYVATRTRVTWLGNASAWYANAAAQGVPVGQTPRAGAIMDTWESGWGHVAYVERVNSDGSWVVSEMNFVGWDVVDTRTIRRGQVPLIGFIYP